MVNIASINMYHAMFERSKYKCKGLTIAVIFPPNIARYQCNHIYMPELYRRLVEGEPKHSFLLTGRYSIEEYVSGLVHTYYPVYSEADVLGRKYDQILAVVPEGYSLKDLAGNILDYCRQRTEYCSNVPDEFRFQVVNIT